MRRILLLSAFAVSLPAFGQYNGPAVEACRAYALKELKLPGWFRGKRPAWFFVAPLLPAVGVALLITRFDMPDVLYGLAISIGTACVIGFTTWLA